jgi:hypothetical protein
MKVSKENINRFKEASLVLFFLVFLFSFTNRSLIKPTESQKQKFTELRLNHLAVVASGSHADFSLVPVPKKVNQDIFKIKTIQFHENKNLVSLNVQINNNSIVKPRVSSRLYYHLFSLKSDEFPVLA